MNSSANPAVVEVVPLTEYEPNPCIGCGKCYETNTCINDEIFNAIYQKMQDSDCLFIVSPHYAPIPAKLPNGVVFMMDKYTRDENSSKNTEYH